MFVNIYVIEGVVLPTSPSSKAFSNYAFIFTFEYQSDLGTMLASLRVADIRGEHCYIDVTRNTEF